MRQPIVFKNNKIEFFCPDPVYKFHGANGICEWPIKNGVGLGTCGIWNFLWRLGYHPTLCRPYELASDVVDNVLFAHADHLLDEPTISHLCCWLKKGKTIVASGTMSAWHHFFEKDLKWKEIHLDNPYSALAYLVPDHKPQLMAPPQWNFLLLNHNEYFHLKTYGNLAEIHGERQTPARALITKIENAPAIIKYKNFYYLNGNPFAAFQSWLQGQENLNPWLAWRHRLFWLDEWVSFMATVLFDINALSRDIPRPGIKGLSDTTIVLKHDLDNSTDTSYLFEETKQDLRGTHAVLKDKNTSFWVNTLKNYSGHEIAFHYNTSTKNYVNEVKRLLLQKGPGAIIPATRQLSGKGLLKQVRWAKQKGIGINTLHRHAAFLLYPEWVDALNEVFESEPEVLGSNSLFRAHVLRWGIDTIDGNYGYLGEWPDSQFPLWYPFKISHAAMGGKILNGWESTSMMEIEPSLLSQMLDYKIKELPQRVFTINFHPAHAHIATFRKHGSFDSFKCVLDIINELKITVKPLNEVYRLANNSVS